jgi:hypothetical protein
LQAIDAIFHSTSFKMLISSPDTLCVLHGLGDFAREVHRSKAVQKQAIYVLFNVAHIYRELAEPQRYFLRMFRDAAFYLKRAFVQLFLAIDMHGTTREPKFAMVIEILNGRGEKGPLDGVVCTLDSLFGNGRHTNCNWQGDEFVQNGRIEAILDLLDDDDMCDEMKNAVEKMFNRYFNGGTGDYDDYDSPDFSGDQPF